MSYDGCSCGGGASELHAAAAAATAEAGPTGGVDQDRRAATGVPEARARVGRREQTAHLQYKARSYPTN